MHLNTHPYVPETRFGTWFLNTPTWKLNVLDPALDDLQRLMPKPLPAGAKIIDVGCGFGHSFSELAKRFQPASIVGLDADRTVNTRAQAQADLCQQTHGVSVDIQQADATDTGFESNTFDLVLCHQTFHHFVEQEAAMAEFFRILKPGGMLFFAESTKRYIETLQIRLLFRHPMQVQKTAPEYVAVVRAAGFDLPDARISYPYLWWSRPDAGILEKLGFKVPTVREETMLNAVAMKPLPAIAA
jgi:ubiquinone/menaquinone biosynthesis C-methylase UbiE